MEGVYGWIAVNYMLGKFNHNDNVIYNEERPTTVGALDMGGASTQITYEVWLTVYHIRGMAHRSHTRYCTQITYDFSTLVAASSGRCSVSSGAWAEWRDQGRERDRAK